jgi:hypothetical protein
MHDRDSARRDELTGLAARLAALAPTSRIDRDQLMFAAGRRAGQRRMRIANCALVATSFAFAGLSAVLLAGTRWPSAPLAGPVIEHVRSSQHLAEGDESKAYDRTDDSDTDRDSLTTRMSESTNFRLMHASVDAISARPADYSPPRVIETDETTPPATHPRTLLHRYLQDMPGRM